MRGSSHFTGPGSPAVRIARMAYYYQRCDDPDLVARCELVLWRPPFGAIAARHGERPLTLADKGPIRSVTLSGITFARPSIGVSRTSQRDVGGNQHEPGRKTDPFEHRGGLSRPRHGRAAQCGNSTRRESR